MTLTSSGGWDSWREEGEATMVHDAPYRPLIGMDWAFLAHAAQAGAVVPCH
jgi:hypothetical protein